MEPKARIEESSRLYEKLIRLYPPSYFNKHREELIQNFEDLRRDIHSRNTFWAFVISDFITSLGRQYMHYVKQHRWAQSALALVVVLSLACAWQVAVLQKAHSTFDAYAAFRGCAQVTGRTDTQGTCVTNSGQAITIVEFDGKWYLQGDLPVCLIHLGSFCINQP